MSILERLKIAKNSTTRIDQKVENKTNEEETTMAEKVEKNVENEEPVKAPAKKPAAKKEEPAEEKLSFWRHPLKKTKKFCSEHKKELKGLGIGLGVGIGTGVAGTIGVGKLGEYRANRRAEEERARRERDDAITIE